MRQSAPRLCANPPVPPQSHVQTLGKKAHPPQLLKSNLWLCSGCKSSLQKALTRDPLNRGDVHAPVSRLHHQLRIGELEMSLKSQSRSASMYGRPRTWNVSGSSTEGVENFVEHKLNLIPFKSSNKNEFLCQRERIYFVDCCSSTVHFSAYVQEAQDGEASGAESLSCVFKSTWAAEAGLTQASHCSTLGGPLV